MFTMSLLVTETRAWQVSIPAARSVSSRCVSPITTRSPSRRARGIPPAAPLLSHPPPPPAPAGQGNPRRVLALVHADHADPQVTQLAHDPGADVAEPGDDDVL